MSEFNVMLVAVLIGVTIGIPVLFLGFRQGGRKKCWRCRVRMLPVRSRVRTASLLPLGKCEGCNIWCLALGPRIGNKSKK